jgi:quinol monooxygenase YgiN
MITIFSSFTVDASQRDSLDAEMAAFLDATADQRRGASIYEYLADPTDPAKVFVFQTWPDDNDFAAWSQQPAFQEILDRARANDTITAASAVVFEGCTTARDCQS